MQTQPEQHRRAARKEKLRAAQLAYLDEVEERTGLTPTEIARAIESDASTLTRFKNKAGYNGTLSDAVIDKIGLRFGLYAPPEARSKAAPAVLEPRHVVPFQGVPNAEASPFQAPKGGVMAALVTAAVAGRVHVAPWLLHSRALEEEGYLPGDVLIVDLHAEPRAGDIVCAQTPVGTVFRLYHPPFLVGAGRDEGARIPQLVDGSISLKGVVEVSIRPLRR